MSDTTTTTTEEWPPSPPTDGLYYIRSVLTGQDLTEDDPQTAEEAEETQYSGDKIYKDTKIYKVTRTHNLTTSRKWRLTQRPSDGRFWIGLEGDNNSAGGVSYVKPTKGTYDTKPGYNTFYRVGRAYAREGIDMAWTLEPHRDPDASQAQADDSTGIAHKDPLQIVWSIVMEAGKWKVADKDGLQLDLNGQIAIAQPKDYDDQAFLFKFVKAK